MYKSIYKQFKGMKKKTKELFDKVASKFRYNIGDKVYLNVLARKKEVAKSLNHCLKDLM